MGWAFGRREASSAVPHRKEVRENWNIAGTMGGLATKSVNISQHHIKANNSIEK